MKPAVRSSRRLQLETLERRQLMAGIVDVSIRGGSLFVTGDEAGNVLAIGRGSDAGTVLIKGSNELTDVTQLRVNGQLVQSATLTGFSRSIYLQLNQGDDQVAVANIDIPRELIINTHGGNDFVFVGNPTGLDKEIINVPSDFNGPVTIGGTAVIDTGSGNDGLGMADIQIGEDLTIQAGDGNDGIGITKTSIGREFRLFSGAGNDQVFLGHPNVQDITDLVVPAALLGPVSVGRTAIISTQAGDDDVAMVDVSAGVNLNMDLGEGNDRVRMYEHTTIIAEVQGESPASSPASIWARDNIFMQLGLGNDQLDVSPRNVATWSSSATLLQAGRLIQVIDPLGTSDINLEAVRATRLEVHTNGGDGDISVYDAVLQSLGIYGHSGINRVTLTSSQIAYDAVIDTGEQNDQVWVVNTSARDLRVNLGSGDDYLKVQGIAIANEAYFDGQGNRDTFVNAGGNTWKRLRKLSFEK